MTSTETLLADYRDRLRRATADLSPGRRAELLDDIDTHLAEATADAPDEASVRQVLDELGTPEAIAEAARAEEGPVRPSGGGETAYDVTAVLALMLGGFVVPVLGWLAGVVMVWAGPRWTTGEKWLGTLAWPVAIVVPVALFLGLLKLFAGNGSASFGHMGLLLAGLLGLVVLVLAMARLLTRSAARRRG